MVIHAIRINPSVVKVWDGRNGCLVARSTDNTTGYVYFGAADDIVEPWPLAMLMYHIAPAPGRPFKKMDRA